MAGGETGDVACDSYHRWQEDIALLHNMGLKHYRLSISWARLLPTGLVKDGVNYDGIRYYGAIFQALQAAGITPMVTLYHWDLPQALHEGFGGWLHPASSDWFRDYAALCFAAFGKYVPYWITFNEPYDVAVYGYSGGNFAPGMSDCPGTCPYIVGQNLLLAHAKAWHAYNDTYKAAQKGSVGLTLNSDYRIPASLSPADVAAAERAMQFQMGWFAHPVYSQNGDYPDVMKNTILSRSLAEGRNTSRLPLLTPAQINYVKGTFDFFGVNMYTSSVVANAPNDPTQQSPPSYTADAQFSATQCPQWLGSGADSHVKFTPWGARGLLNWISGAYGNPLTIVTECGWTDGNGTTDDPYRVNFFKHYVNNVLKARRIDGVNVGGFTAWSLMDNLEWTAGYTKKFGLHSVDFQDPARPRRPKLSAAYISSLSRANGFPPCALLSPCAHGACSDSADGAAFACACDDGWTGPQCDLRGTVCPVRVHNGGSLLLEVDFTSGSSAQSVYIDSHGAANFTCNSNSTITFKGIFATPSLCLVPSSACTRGLQATCTGNSAATLTCSCQ